MANRKQRRKTKTVYDEEYTQSTKKVIITIGIVVVVFLGFYFMTVAINNKNRGLKTKNPETVEPTIQYDEILADSTFTMKDKEYFVLFYDFDGPEAVYFETMFNEYASDKEHHIYKVDLSNALNQKYIAADKSNKKAKNASQLKIKNENATLIKIKKGKVRIRLSNLKIRTVLERYLDSFSTALPERYIVEDYYITQNNSEVIIIYEDIKNYNAEEYAVSEYKSKIEKLNTLELYFDKKHIVNVNDYPHFLISGSSGSGKSYLANEIVIQAIIKKWEVVIWAL